MAAASSPTAGWWTARHAARTGRLDSRSRAGPRNGGPPVIGALQPLAAADAWRYTWPWRTSTSIASLVTSVSSAHRQRSEASPADKHLGSVRTDLRHDRHHPRQRTELHVRGDDDQHAVH